MFREPVQVDSDLSVFNLVWTYVAKELDKRKKARCTCDGSTRSGQVRVLDYTYANCVDQTSSRLFYACVAAENLAIFGADVSNAFGEAPPPKQGFYIRPDKAFRNWVIRRLADFGRSMPAISFVTWASLLRHTYRAYSGLVEGERVLFKRQVGDFEVAAPSERVANILFDKIDEQITFPLKCMGLVDMFNGLDILQTMDHIKIYCQTYIERISDKHLRSWMTIKDTPTTPMSLPTTDTFLKNFL
ncbi:hypothetical protein ACHAWF_004261 [Thalassiosira exigua]